MKDIIILMFRLMVCIFEIWMLFGFYNNFLKNKPRKSRNNIFIILVFALIIFAINSIDNTILNLICVPVVYFVLAIVAFNGNVFKKLFGTLIGTIVILGTELIIVAVLNITSKELIESSMVNEPSLFVLTIIVKMVTFIVFEIIKQFSSKESEMMDGKTFCLYMLTPLSCLGIMFSVVFCRIDFTENSLAKSVLIIFFFCMLIGNAAIFYGYNRYAKILVEKEKNRRTVMEQNMELESYKKVNVANDRYITLLHDTNHHIKTVYSLLKKNKKDDAMNMLSKLFDKYEKSEMIEYSGNIILNTILSDYKEKSSKENIECDIFVERGFNIEYVDEIDLVAMLSNLLSNSHEAAAKSDMKKIRIQMFMQNDGSFSVIKIENSYTSMIVEEDSVLKTTKQNKEFHGLGIKSVQQIAEKYNGWLSSTWSDNVFKSVLILENSMC